MKSRQITFVDGKATREAIEKITGTKKGLVKICKSKGLPQATLSRICINGYGDPKIIERYIKAGIPIVRSNKPVPSRTNVEYTRAYRKEQNPEAPAENKSRQSILPEVSANDLKGFLTMQPPPKGEMKQLSIEDLTEAEQIKELIITHLTALIEDLKKI